MEFECKYREVGNRLLLAILWMGDMLGRVAAVNQWVNNSAVLLKCEKMTKYWLVLATVILPIFCVYLSYRVHFCRKKLNSPQAWPSLQEILYVWQF